MFDIGFLGNVSGFNWGGVISGDVIQNFGLIENMSYFICPECGHEEKIFGKGATDKFLKDNKIPLLGKIPIEPAFASSGDTGKPLVLDSDKDYMKVIYNDLASSLVDHLDKIEKPTPKVGDITVEVTGK